MTRDDVNALIGALVINVEDCSILELVDVQTFPGPPDWWEFKYRSDTPDLGENDLPWGIPAGLIGNSEHYIIAASREDARMRAPQLHADYNARQANALSNAYIPF